MGGTEDEIHDIALRLNALNHPGPSDWLRSWTIPLALATVGWISLYYGTIGDLRTSVEHLKTVQESVTFRLTALEVWRENVTNARFTAQEGNALRQEIMAVRSEQNAANSQQDNRMNAFVDSVAARQESLTKRMDALENRLNTKLGAGRPDR